MIFSLGMSFLILADMFRRFIGYMYLCTLFAATQNTYHQVHIATDLRHKSPLGALERRTVLVR